MKKRKSKLISKRKAKGKPKGKPKREYESAINMGKQIKAK